MNEILIYWLKLTQHVVVILFWVVMFILAYNQYVVFKNMDLDEISENIADFVDCRVEYGNFTYDGICTYSDDVFDVVRREQNASQT